MLLLKQQRPGRSGSGVVVIDRPPIWGRKAFAFTPAEIIRLGAMPAQSISATYCEPMPHDHLTLVRTAYDAYNRRDAAALQGLCHEQCTIHTVLEGQVEPQPFRGRDGVREWIDNEDAVWESVRIDELELRDLDDHRVFTAAVAFVRGRESGMEIRIPVWSVIDLRDGQLYRLRSYPDEAHGRQAAELKD
jgi:ketosteroid isomerase-like protein